MSEEKGKKVSLVDLKNDESMMRDFMRDVKETSDKSEAGGAKRDAKVFVEACLDVIADSLQRTKSLSATGAALRKKASVRPDILRAAVLEVMSEKKDADARFTGLLAILKKDSYGTQKQKTEPQKTKTDPEAKRASESEEAWLKKLADVNETWKKALEESNEMWRKKVEDLERDVATANELVLRLQSDKDDTVSLKTSMKNFPFFKEAYGAFARLLMENGIDVPAKYRSPPFSETVQGEPPMSL